MGVLDTLKIDSDLSKDERSLINWLSLKSFDCAWDKIDDMNELKCALENTKIKIVTEDDWTIDDKALSDIATEFDMYVEKWDGWKLKLKANITGSAPWRIKNIIENPKNNDLAFLVQKLAGLIEYQTASLYTNRDINVKVVTIDKTLGNQTKRALWGLKHWIENTPTETGNVYDGDSFLSQSFLAGVLKDKNDDVLNNALGEYHLQLVDWKIIPQKWYEFIDTSSSNFAVRKVEDSDADPASTGTGESISSQVVETNFTTNTVGELVKKELEGSFSASLFLNYFWHSLKITPTLNGNNLIRLSTSFEGNSVLVDIPLWSFLTNSNEFDSTKTNGLLVTNKVILHNYLLAKKFTHELRQNWWMKFTVDQIFPNLNNSEYKDKVNVQAAIIEYFNLFKDKKLLIDDDASFTKSSEGKIHIWLDNIGRDKKFHRPTDNEKLIFDAKDIANPEWWLDEDKLKAKLKDIVEDIINNHYSKPQ